MPKSNGVSYYTYLVYEKIEGSRSEKTYCVPQQKSLYDVCAIGCFTIYRMRRWDLADSLEGQFTGYSPSLNALVV